MEVQASASSGARPRRAILPPGSGPGLVPGSLTAPDNFHILPDMIDHAQTFRFRFWFWPQLPQPGTTPEACTT